jgi:hypothetical protein
MFDIIFSQHSYHPNQLRQDIQSSFQNYKTQILIDTTPKLSKSQKSHTMSAKYTFNKGLKELRFLFCHTSEHSEATRLVIALSPFIMKKKE